MDFHQLNTRRLNISLAEIHNFASLLLEKCAKSPSPHLAPSTGVPKSSALHHWLPGLWDGLVAENGARRSAFQWRDVSRICRMCRPALSRSVFLLPYRACHPAVPADSLRENGARPTLVPPRRPGHSGVGRGGARRHIVKIIFIILFRSHPE